MLISDDRGRNPIYCLLCLARWQFCFCTASIYSLLKALTICHSKGPGIILVITVVHMESMAWPFNLESCYYKYSLILPLVYTIYLIKYQEFGLQVRQRRPSNNVSHHFSLIHYHGAKMVNIRVSIIAYVI